MRPGAQVNRCLRLHRPGQVPAWFGFTKGKANCPVWAPAPHSAFPAQGRTLPRQTPRRAQPASPLQDVEHVPVGIQPPPPTPQDCRAPGTGLELQKSVCSETRSLTHRQKQGWELARAKGPLGTAPTASPPHPLPLLAPTILPQSPHPQLPRAVAC